MKFDLQIEKHIHILDNVQTGKRMTGKEATTGTREQHLQWRRPATTVPDGGTRSWCHAGSGSWLA